MQLHLIKYFELPENRNSSSIFVCANGVENKEGDSHREIHIKI